MSTDFADPMGLLIEELRTANVASGRVRTFQPDVGDARSHATGYRRFVVLVDLGGEPIRQIIQRRRIAVRAYGVTKEDASRLYNEVRDVWHLAGIRSDSGVVVYNSRDDTGGSIHTDPDTGQPYYDGVYEITAGLRLVG